MRIKVFACGGGSGRSGRGKRDDVFYEKRLAANYLLRASRLSTRAGFMIDSEIVESTSSSSRDPGKRCHDDSMRLLACLPDDYIPVMLDEGGAMFSSMAFSSKLCAWRESGCQGIGFLIGSADGLDLSALPSSGFRLSLSLLTFSHRLARVILCEQLYRSMCILSNHPYHRD